MAEKKNKNKDKDAKAEAADNAREAKEARRAKDVFKYQGEAENKLPPQAQGIVNILKEAGKKGLSRAEIVEAMTGVIETRQPVGRILTYYQKRLVEEGCITIDQG